MKQVFQVLAAILGILSFTSLTKTAFDIGFVHALNTLLEYYDAFLSEITKWIEPIILYALSPIEDMLNVEFDLNPYWKHITVVMAVYLGSNVRHIWQRGTRNAKSVNTVTAIVVTMVGGISVGLVPTEPSTQMLVAAIPITALAVFAFVFDLRLAFDLKAFGKVFPRTIVNWQPVDGLKTWRSRYARVNKHSFYFMVAFAVAAFAAYFARFTPPVFDAVAYPGVAVFVGFMVILTVYMLGHTVYRAATHRVSVYPTLAAQIMADGTFRVTRYMLTTIMGTLLFLFFNAGLGALGL